MAWFIAAFAVVCSIGFVAFLAASAYGLATGAPFVPTNDGRMAEMLRFAAIKEGERVIDLGSGDGRLVIAAARQGAISHGREIGFFLWLWSQANIVASGTRVRASTSFGDFWQLPLHDADVVFVYLLPRHMERLERKLRSELRPGSRIVSNAFTFPGWEPMEANGRGVYQYRVG